MAQAQANLQSEALPAALHQQRLVERVAQLLDDIASGPSIRDTRNRLCVQYLKSLQSQDPDYHNLGVVGLDEKVSCHALSSDAVIEAGDRQFFRQVMAGKKFAVGEYGREAVGPGGLARVYAYAPVDGAAGGELFVAISVPSELITAGPDALLRLDIAALLLMTVFGVAFAWWMGNRLIVNRARAILKQANEVTRGNLAARVGPGLPEQDEIGQISLAFNRMAESLQMRRNELDAALLRTDEERILLDLVLNSMSEGVIAVDAGERFLMVNESARKLYGSAHGTASAFHDWRSGHELLMLDGKTPCELADRPLMQAMRGASMDNWVGVLRRPGHEDRVLRVSARPLRDATGQLFGGVAVMSDITELRAAEEFAASQQQVLARIAAGVPLEQALEAIVQLVEKNSPASLCSILLVRDQQLRHGAAPSLPQSFVQAIDGLPVREGIGACGTSAFRKMPVAVRDVSSDPLMQDFRELLAAHGLRACWSTPVTSADGEVLATFAIYRRHPGKPQARDEELMATASGLARIALERARAEAALVSSEARFRELAENIDDVFYNVDARTKRVLYVSPGYQTIWGRTCQSLYAEPGSYARAALAEDRPVLALAHRRNRAGERSEVEYRILTPDGQTRWIRDQSYPVFNAAGELERVVGTARDVSASKQADLALSRTNRALQMLSRSSIAINRINDEAGLLAEVCRVAVDVGGYHMAWVGYAQDDEGRSIQVMAHAGDETGYLASIALSWREDLATG